MPPAPIPEPPQLSRNAEIIVSGQWATVEDVAHLMKCSPRRAAKLFKEMQESYGDKPTFLHLALFTGASNLVEMAQQVMAARRAKEGQQPAAS
ncbi:MULTISPECIES: hypothetical protein [Hymenobacter]|uniref:Uncharacterized protein n=1 Tax=Hymenobacter mucosus TaxID=1411120 RepID=A0A239BC29_9BACT|nr:MULTISPECIES: hypothetical protein [Hymenobacter]MDF7815481.1 hypothetical protein [Hymenobacter sp. YC55]SNS05470.1 hypothetical protein SAMN06269173_12121 [Hymenobacter mucosus]